jgi:hypothetical protein
MSAYDEATDKEEVRDLAILAAQIKTWAGTNTEFEEALVMAGDCLEKAAIFIEEEKALAVVPVLGSLEPATLEVPGPDTEIVLHGTGFNENTIINWNGGDEVTEFVSDTELRTIVKPSTVSSEIPLPFVLPVYVWHGDDNRSNVLDFTFIPAAEAKRGRDGKA